VPAGRQLFHALIELLSAVLRRRCIFRLREFSSASTSSTLFISSCRLPDRNTSKESRGIVLRCSPKCSWIISTRRVGFVGSSKNPCGYSFLITFIGIQAANSCVAFYQTAARAQRGLYGYPNGRSGGLCWSSRPVLLLRGLQVEPTPVGSWN
jgi:hypothetical protein